ncbi:hypothetical protein EMCRGX_G012301 [Ephydatia muelleri]
MVQCSYRSLINTLANSEVKCLRVIKRRDLSNERNTFKSKTIFYHKKTRLKTERATRPIPKRRRPLRDSYKADPEKKKTSVRYSYKVDPEKKKASVRDSYKADPEKKKASVRDSYKADPEKKKASVRDSYNADIESKQSAKRQRYQENLEENRAAKRQRHEEDVEENLAAKRQRYQEDVEDNRAAKRQRYQEDVEENRAAKRQRYQEDFDENRAAKRQRYQEDVEENRAAKRQRYQEDVEENRAAKRQKYEDNSAAIKASERNRYWNDPAVRLAKRAAERKRYRRGHRTTTTTPSYSLYEPKSHALMEYNGGLEMLFLGIVSCKDAFCKFHPLLAQKVVTRSARAAKTDESKKQGSFSHAQDLPGTGSTLGLSNLGSTPDTNAAEMLALIIVLSLSYLYETKGAGCPSFNINYPPMRTLLCPGDIITYTCAFSSGFNTIITWWTGSPGFQCPSVGGSPANIIQLTQSAGAPLNTVPGSCGNLSAVMTNISGTCYTSVLTIPTPQYFNGTTVTCRDGIINALIGSDTLNIQLASSPGAPSGLQSSSLCNNSLTIQWTPASSGFNASSYNSSQ